MYTLVDKFTQLSAGYPAQERASVIRLSAFGPRSRDLLCGDERLSGRISLTRLIRRDVVSAIVRERNEPLSQSLLNVKRDS